MAKLAMTSGMGVVAVKKMKGARPTVVIPMPIEATTRGSTLSESRPATGDTAACTMGCATRMTPAISGLNPRTLCK